MNPRPIIHVVNTATTVSGPAAAGTLTSSQNLQTKTAIGVIEQRGKQKTLSIYRLSSTAPGQYSRDIYVLKKRQWKYSRKHKDKYLRPPLAPNTASKYSDGVFEFWTMKAITPTEIKRLKKLLIQIK